ncbi:hypothetical protein N9L85_01910 [Euryarchaeota archaeon]|nr:hypothetical protein [Euryarchaeota archaeon]MDA9156346.1 hypothetical protein [Candidatus Poseidoniaceae archaeon]
MNIARTLPSLLMTTLLLAALLPLGSVSATPTEESEFYYGVEYDWSSVDTDLENFTGVDVPEILSEIMGAADDAGFNLIIGQLQTGASNVYVHHTEDITPQTIQDNNGNDVSVWSRTDDVTLRHGILADTILQTDWTETNFGSDPTSIDIDIVQTLEQVLTVDMTYTEYLDDSYNLIGADMEFSMDVSALVGLNIDVLLEGGGEEFPVDFNTELDLGYSITDSTSEWRLGSPNAIYVDLSAADDNYYWECGEYECGDITGDYTGAVDYSFTIEGIPTEDFGLDAGEFDLEISDSLSESGDFDMEVNAEFDFSKGETLTVDLGDGEGLTTQVQSCDTCPPGNPLMFIMMGHVLSGSGEAFAEQVAEDIGEDITDSLESIFATDDDGTDGQLSYYHFQADSVENNEPNTDNLALVTLNQGNDINWATVMVQVSVDGNAPVTCSNPGMPADGDCSLVEFGSVGDQYWSVGDGVTIMDDADMCPENNYCSVDITVTDTMEGQILSSTWTSVEGFTPANAPAKLTGDLHFWGDNITVQTALSGNTSVLQSDDSAMFTCDDGSEIGFTSVNDGESACSDGSDEAPTDGSTKMFTCNDGSEVEWTTLNDGYGDCPTLEDEGVLNHYTLQMNVFDDAGTPLSSIESTICDSWMCDSNPEWATSWSEDSGVAVPSTYGESTMCMTASISETGASSPLVEFSEMCHSQWIGPELGYADVWEDEAMNLRYDMSAYDWSSYEGATWTYSLMDPNQNQLDSGTMVIDGSDNSYYMDGNIDVLEVGEYCLMTELTQDGASTPYLSEMHCTMVEESDDEVSDRVAAVFEALGESGLEDVLEDFGMHLEDRLEDVEPFEEFPYDDGMWAPMWSNEHAAMVGVGVYVMNDDGAYTLAGPETQGYMDDAPAKLSIHYLTGADANAATNGMEEATSIDDIVNVDGHDLGAIEEDLIAAGVDVSNLTLPETDTSTGTDGGDNPTPPTAEELAEDSGLDLPFLSPISMIAVIVLAGVVSGGRRDSNTDENEE